MLSENEIDRIAAAVHALRPDWPASSLRTLIKTKLDNRPRRDVAVALTWVACESATSKPARVLEAGPWWKAVAIEAPITRYPPKRGQDCRDHPGEWPDSCRGCASDKLAPVVPLPVDHQLSREDLLAKTRDEIATARAQHAAHLAAKRPAQTPTPEESA